MKTFFVSSYAAAEMIKKETFVQKEGWIFEVIIFPPKNNNPALLLHTNKNTQKKMNATSRRNEEVEIARERVEINKVVDAINLESIKKLNYENVVTSERIPADLMFSLSQVIALPSAMVSEYNRK